MTAAKISSHSSAARPVGRLSPLATPGSGEPFEAACFEAACFEAPRFDAACFEAAPFDADVPRAITSLT